MGWSKPDPVRNLMNRSHLATCVALVLGALVLPVAAQSTYRYLDADGRVVYSDKPPPPSAKDVQSKSLPQNVIETDPMPFASRDAATKYPVTLYTFDCDVCKEAQALLVKRGVPFTAVIVTEQDGAEKLKAVTGKQAAPVLQVGDKKVLEGFNANRWQAALDDAGYPSSAPPPRPLAPKRVTTTNAGSAASGPNASSAPPAAESPPAPGTDYPK
jgi:glutaredoxin